MHASVIFDMDGVLFDSHPLHLSNWRQIFSECGRSVTETELEILYDGATREEMFRRFLGELSPGESAQFSQRKDELFQELEVTLQTVPGLEEFFQVLEDAGIRKAVVTSGSRSRALRLLNRFRLTPRFATIVTSADVAKGKLDPTIFRLALNRLGEAPENCLVIEDSPRAISVARTLGIRCIGISAGSRRQRLAAAGADHIVSDFTALSLEEIGRILGKASQKLPNYRQQKIGTAYSDST